ncbi:MULTISPECIES: histidine phosphatase family protein [unclassified Acinetobacter]|uniref:histidine phosphatase family protein n=1 Tax=unclassified Acinetobacter TaxID=196816 RepID=UPI0029344356|nr:MULTISPECIES: histidine phosphatase family protein [unclassified Acinetobacter]WOE32113.1 histidine phosphatase family protein [Acinetobacter sp. SAAs470]WOE37582.1 histidine phosphatase family protein [Acinetobacter sp. SAAs474]
MTTIYFIRHGQASFGEACYDKLSHKGEQQAKILGQYLDKILINEKPHIVAGSMQRHQQTAYISLQECFPNAQVYTNSAWNEFNHQQVFARYDARFADPQVLKQVISQQQDPFKYLGNLFEKAVQRWVSGEYDHDYDETWLQFKHRVETALQYLCQEISTNKPDSVLVYTSGGVISLLAGKMLDLSIEKTFELTWAVANTSLTTLKVLDNAPYLLTLNEHYFLKAQNPQLLTWI